MSNNEHLRILDLDPWLTPFEGDLNLRMRRYYETKARILPQGGKLTDFANGALYYGFHRDGRDWIYREWAPAASALHLIGDFNGWDRETHPMKRGRNGDWEIRIPESAGLREGSAVKVHVSSCLGGHDRIPLYIHKVLKQDSDNSFYGVVTDPDKAYPWTDGAFHPAANIPPLVYETHIGMATEEERIGTYREFTETMLPRIRADGYNTIQLMAVMQHPYYGSFGYQVSNFFAASSWYGDPEDLKALVNRAHELGLTVVLDLVHSHAVKNFNEGINCFDGTAEQFFLSGGEGDHPAWDSKIFNYGKPEVLHFLLSNIKYWLTEYHFDGFRFDGVTSMLYKDHGLGTAFDNYNKYFSMNTCLEAVTYLQLAGELTREVRPEALLIAEDMSGMPGMCLPVSAGGIGFDYRLSMGVPDYWIKTIKEKSDEQWSMWQSWNELTGRRPGEKSLGYCESHDQALVGDKTLMFRLADKEMYWHMDKASNNDIIDRAMALHKMIRLLTSTLAGEGYLNFMGNEFGHPEWIDFPREGNGWSYAHCRRYWSLADNQELRYSWLGEFDKAMIYFLRNTRLLDTKARNLWADDNAKLLAFEKKGYVFIFNFHPVNSYPDFFLPLDFGDTWQVFLDSDE